MPFNFLKKVVQSFSPSTNKTELDPFTNKFGFQPGNWSYYRVAFTHRSQPLKDTVTTVGAQNERLEFLGDAIIGTIVAEVLFYHFPNADEGALTRMRSKLVRRKNLNYWAKAIGIPGFLSYDKSLDSNQQFSESIYGNAFEAFIGAIFLDKGYEFTSNFLEKQVINPFVDFKEIDHQDLNYKSLLIEWVQKVKKTIHFQLEDSYEEEGKNMVFCISCWIDGEKVGQGEAYQKKQAEQEAARQAMDRLGIDAKS